MDDFDRNDPKFGRWHLSHLPPLTDAQHEALWDDSVKFLIFRFVS